MENIEQIINERIENHRKDILFYKERVVFESGNGVLNNFENIKAYVSEIQKIKLRISELEIVLSLIK